MGLPEALDSSTITVSALPFRAYNLIFYEWFRDQNVGNVPTLNTGNGPDAVADYAVFESYKKHDYFTSALPYLQKGTAQSIQSPVVGIGKETQVYAETTTALYETGATATRSYAISERIDDAVADHKWQIEGSHASTGFPMIYAEVDINALRLSVAVQRYLERDARGGTRYVEKIKTHFGVTNPDFRLQRPEYLAKCQ